jgi:hypothetical protein
MHPSATSDAADVHPRATSDAADMHPTDTTADPRGEGRSSNC